MVPLTRFRALVLVTALLIVVVLFNSPGPVQDEQGSRAALTLKEPGFLDVEVTIPNPSIGTNGAGNSDDYQPSPLHQDNLQILPRPPQPTEDAFSPPVKQQPRKYTRNLVIGALRTDNTTWTSLLPATDPPLNPLIYIVDDPTQSLTIPTNKGNEAMVYLTYIITHYSNLPDISIFAHASRTQWHNPPLLDSDTLQLLSRLNSAKVAKDGYVNLRCDSNECPAHIRTANTVVDEYKLEESAMADAWRGLFPDDPVPAILSQACCSQFAVSRAAVLARPLDEYVRMRDWLMQTELIDDVSGRVFEYLWQWIFARKHVFCPESHKCYCDLYGVCFEGVFKYREWMGLNWRREDLEEELVALQSGAVVDDVDDVLEEEEADRAAVDQEIDEDAEYKPLPPPPRVHLSPSERIPVIIDEINSLTLDLDERKAEALARGVEVKKWREEVEGEGVWG